MSAALPVLVEQTPGPRKRLHVLTLTPFYPSDDDDAQGCFVAEPLRAMKDLEITNSVLAVRPFYRGQARPSASAPSTQWKHYFSLPGGVGLPISGASLFASIFYAVQRIHRRYAMDLIHAHSALPCGHAASLLSRQLGIPFVVTVHGLDVFNSCFLAGAPAEWRRRASIAVYQSANNVVCVSRKVQRILQSGMPAAV